MAEISARLAPSLITAVSTCLENMAFMSVALLSAEEECSASGPHYSASLLVHDPIQGEMRLEMPEEVLGEIAGAIYASPASELSARQRQDILAELLNTIAGLFLTDLLPSDQDFRIGLPEVEEGTCATIEPPAGSWKFKTDYGVFCITINATNWSALSDELSDSTP